jgi:hypothetical protein
MCCTLSLLTSLAFPSLNPYFIDNLKRVIQFTTSFFYFFYFQWLLEKTKIDVKLIVLLFIVWFLSFLIFFYFDPLNFNAFVSNYYGRVAQSQEDLESHFRFSYIFSDPNTAAYFFLIATSPIVIKTQSIKWKYFILFVLALILFLAQSRGAILSLIIVFVLNVFKFDQLKKTILNLKQLFIIFILLISFYLIFLYLEQISKDDVLFKIAFDRFFNSEDSEKGGFRFEIWEKFLKNFIPLPFGRGYNLLINGVSSPPHSDFLRLVYSYGFISVFAVVPFLFGKLRKIEPLIIPGIIAFAINTLIDEQKVFSLFLCFLAIFTTRDLVEKDESKNII